MTNPAAVLRDLSNHYGSELFKEVDKIRNALLGKGLSEDEAISVITESLVSIISSLFAYSVTGATNDEEVDDAKAERAASDLTEKILNFLRDEYVKNDCKVVRIDLDEDGGDHGKNG